MPLSSSSSASRRSRPADPSGIAPDATASRTSSLRFIALTYQTLPVPAFEERTARFVAGVVTIGVEYRLLDEATILEFYGSDARAKFGNVAPAGIGDVVQEDGLCVHVFGTHDGLEYVRLDCFDDAPHYHYLDPHTPRNVVVDYDAAANGPMVDWALRTLCTRLSAMLGHAGAVGIAASVDPAEIARILPDVTEQVRRAMEQGSGLAAGG
jgi:hypothetical protein